CSATDAQHRGDAGRAWSVLHVAWARGQCAGHRRWHSAQPAKSVPDAIRPLRPGVAALAAPSSRYRPDCAGNTGRSTGTV
nr:hypothetical protein [Tanacetum cinerariifolium]